MIRVAVAMLIAVAALAAAQPAAAQTVVCPNPNNPNNCYVVGADPTGLTSGLSVDIDGSGGSQPIPVGSSVFEGCNFQRAVEDEEFVTGRRDIASINIDGTVFDEDHWVIYCPDLAASDLAGGLGAYTFFPVTDGPPAAVVAAMIDDAYRRIPFVAFNPITSPDGDEDIMLVTNMTTFLWVDQTEWNTPVSSTSSLIFPGVTYTVTTTATPAIANWSGGDAPATCTGDQMVPYEFGIGGDDAQASECTMVYLRSSAVHDNEVVVDVTWDVVFTCDFPDCGGGGPLPPVTITSVRPVVVGEILAVATPNP